MTTSAFAAAQAQTHDDDTHKPSKPPPRFPLLLERALTVKLCPADAASLKSIQIHAQTGAQGTAYMCDTCGGALLGEQAQAAMFGSALQIDADSLVPGERPCPCGTGRLSLMPLGALVLESCSACKSVWFDAGKLLVVTELIRQHGSSAALDARHPLGGLMVRCSDCGVQRVRRDQMLDVGSGMICDICLKRQASASNQPFKYRSAQITVQHQGNPADAGKYRGEVSATLPFDSAVIGTLKTPNLWQKLLKLFGKRGVSVQRASLDESLWVQSAIPKEMQAFFGIHGVPELTLELLSIGQRCEVQLSARRFVLVVEGWVPSNTDARFPPPARFESIARRLYDRVLFFHQQRGVHLPPDLEDQWSPVPTSP